VEAVNTAAQLLIILVDIPHCRADAAAAGAVAALATLLKPVAEDAVSATEEVPSITCSATCPCGLRRAHDCSKALFPEVMSILSLILCGLCGRWQPY